MEGCCAEEVLLLQPELFSSEVVVVGIENFRDVLGKILLENGFDVVTIVEEAEVEVARRHGRPQSQRVHDVVAVTRDRRVVRHGQDRLKKLNYCDISRARQRHLNLITLILISTH